MTEQAHNITFGITRKSLHATVIHACPQCGAPGVDKKGQPVGDVCPNCGGKRKPDRNLGELCASMPLWIWNAVLVVKWCLIKGKMLMS